MALRRYSHQITAVKKALSGTIDFDKIEMSLTMEEDATDEELAAVNPDDPSQQRSQTAERLRRERKLKEKEQILIKEEEKVNDQVLQFVESQKIKPK